MKLCYLLPVLLLWSECSVAGMLSARHGQECLDAELLESGWLRASYRTGDACNQPAFPASPYVLDSATKPAQMELREAEGKQNASSGRVQLTLDSTSLCLDVYDKGKQRAVTRVCPGTGEQGWLTLTMDRGNTEQLYGLGQAHPAPGKLDGDWLQRGKRVAGSKYGNQMVDAQGGLVGNTQFPILYALGKDMTPWALFLDNPYPHNWDFHDDPFKVGVKGGDDLRFYVRLGDSLADLRRSYMQLVGTPLVPNRKLFGLWVSEYGYDDWAELDGVSQSLQKNGFPLDGMVLDLQWFGGIREDSDDSRMGALSWDESHFPNPADKIKTLAQQQHLGLMLIEESYISKGLPEHQRLHEQGLLVKQPDGQPVYLAKKPWWGKGGMIDWSNPATGAFWHDWKRQPLVEMGILGHWTDLGEPMDYAADGVYHGYSPGKTSHADVHNLYNLLWHRSIFDGYQRHGNQQRPFMLSRAGGPGMQRYGAGMWSGDIPARLSNLASHLNAQMQMSLSGVDYFGSDAGGFYRNSFDGKPEDYNTLYTRWFAVAALIDLPLRPHADNVCNCYQTAPDKVGDVASNLANVRLRYELLPYYYSLAHRAHRTGDPIIAPAVLADEHDPNLRGMGGQKLIGDQLLAALETRPDSRTLRVYLPKGEWFDYHSHTWRSSQGEWLEDVPLFQHKVYRLPLYARAGAIIPLLEVGNDSADAFGRKLGSMEKPSLLKLKIFPHSQPTEFTLYEDDGETTAYLQGKVRSTRIRQQRDTARQQVWIEAAQGDYANAPQQREIQLVLAEIATVEAVMVDGKPLPAADKTGFGWQRSNSNTLMLRLPALATAQAHHIDIRYQAKESQ
ncbi:MAG TPA: glycoside hydrolase family 31 protein [Candidatus Thiothrix moscowensis]|uniref:TIM-barrel domain-containing protein n=1 Tax=unclassified Thiothrix TaxID=2636184 RepID=UPI0025E4F2C6|nr:MULTISPECIES: TIM-barrel domain-containing protein [unclassified Thiothrix]HRJ53259.1 glycoside hydrolase family 31 protein [Candidatus Thiothrix moscowensis]HRJ93171.1 glycoside hydrolase family 31 protein [Candidatus Thiothrix moscowensis]